MSVEDPWSDDEMAATASEALGAGQDSDLPQDVRFLASSVRVVGRRLRRKEYEHDPEAFAIFVLKPMPRNDPAVEDYDLVWRLDEAATALSGRLWLTNEGLNFGHSLPDVPGESELIDWMIDELALGDYPTVVFDPTVDGGSLRFYPKGLANLGEVRTYGMADLHAVNSTDVKAVIDFVVEHGLVTPQQQISNSSTWANAPKYYVSSNAEALIQSQLRIALKKQWPACEVQHEMPVKSGRFDLAICYFDQAASTWTYFGVLELKVLKDRSATGKTPYNLAHNQTTAADGLAQAAAYQKNVGATWGMLCCFDHRKDEDEADAFLAAVEDAQDVEIYRWRILNASKLTRV